MMIFYLFESVATLPKAVALVSLIPWLYQGRVAGALDNGRNDFIKEA
jgi:hypothetical protein